MEDGNGWGKWKIHVISELEEGKEERKKILRSLGRVREDIAGLKVKATVWGLLGGAVPVVIGLAIYFIRELMIKGGTQ